MILALVLLACHASPTPHADHAPAPDDDAGRTTVAYVVPQLPKPLAAIVRTRKNNARMFGGMAERDAVLARLDEGTLVTITSLPTAKWAAVTDTAQHAGYVRRGSLALFPFRAVLRGATVDLFAEDHVGSATTPLDPSKTGPVVVTAYVPGDLAAVDVAGPTPTHGFVSVHDLTFDPPRPGVAWGHDATVVGDVSLEAWTPTTFDANGVPTVLRVDDPRVKVRGVGFPAGSTVDLDARGALLHVHASVQVHSGSQTVPGGTVFDVATDCAFHVHVPGAADAPCFAAGDDAASPE